jgi:hypothetical protein
MSAERNWRLANLSLEVLRYDKHKAGLSLWLCCRAISMPQTACDTLEMRMLVAPHMLLLLYTACLLPIPIHLCNPPIPEGCCRCCCVKLAAGTHIRLCHARCMTFMRSTRFTAHRHPVEQAQIYCYCDLGGVGT